MGFLRSTLHRFIPAHFHDPFGLALRLIRTGDPAARFAMGSALLGIGLIPLDLAFSLAESRRVRRAARPTRPIVLVCGPPRSGTTLVSQALIANLPVAYFNNLTSVFPRSPLTANRAFGRWLGAPEPGYHSYYGRSRRFSGANDALYLWDRWLGRDRAVIPARLEPGARDAMIRFFGAMESATEKPLVAKNNNLNGFAHLVAEALDTATILCLRREPVYLAQSLLRARREIHGDEEIAYGLAEAGAESGDTPVGEVCRQVLFHERLMEDQLRRLGASRFRIVSYEGFCADPNATIRMVAEEILAIPYTARTLPGFEKANRVRIEPETFREIESTLERLRASRAGSAAS